MTSRGLLRKGLEGSEYREITYKKLGEQNIRIYKKGESLEICGYC